MGVGGEGTCLIPQNSSPKGNLIWSDLGCWVLFTSRQGGHAVTQLVLTVGPEAEPRVSVLRGGVAGLELLTTSISISPPKRHEIKFETRTVFFFNKIFIYF